MSCFFISKTACNCRTPHTLHLLICCTDHCIDILHIHTYAVISFDIFLYIMVLNLFAELKDEPVLEPYSIVVITFGAAMVGATLLVVIKSITAASSAAPSSLPNTMSTRVPTTTMNSYLPQKQTYLPYQYNWG